jgi:hypothetical protein
MTKRNQDAPAPDEGCFITVYGPGFTVSLHCIKGRPLGAEYIFIKGGRRWLIKNLYFWRRMAAMVFLQQVVQVATVVAVLLLVVAENVKSLVSSIVFALWHF